MSYKLLFSGSSIEVMLLKGLLEQEGIPPIIKDRATSGVLAGFYGGDVVQLLVKEDVLDKAKQILKEFQQNKQE